MNSKQPVPAPKSKRGKAGHENTTSAICLFCYEQHKKDQKKKFSFSRYNQSSLKEHMKVHNCTDHFIRCDDPRAVEAMQALNKLERRLVQIYAIYVLFMAKQELSCA